ncbi:N-acyl-D-amino-acid deacylase family protein [Enemella evansiae]|uniref:N-acyl-D-amino-acid deacylase family protein n=1 Tax=Enemella evansiae TaxID=2016499 RepID=UPI000B96130A|nr:D-aminoacylase [Enemella evansiae]OYO05557.1 N-acyl-D-amino-acid deacylase [Enemella evansiae]
MLELVIDEVDLLDGTGAPPRRAAVGIGGGRIETIGEPGSLRGGQRVDGTGQVLAPGFIDLHSHADFSIEEEPAAITQLAQGVTTLITGNCGTSPFPVTDLAALRDSSAFLRPELSWQWRDLTGYAEAISTRRPAVNLGLQVGHGALRIAVLGYADRPATATELARMGDLLAAAADQGAVGFSTGLIYAPGSYADAAEVQALAAVAAEHGLLYSTHLRNETDRVLDAVDEAIETARRSGVRLEISHIKAMGPRNHGKVAGILERIDAARAEGIDVAADVYPYTASSTTLTSRLPDWALAGGVRALLERLADEHESARIEQALAERFDGEIDPGGIVLANLPAGAYSDQLGRSLVEIAERTGRDPAAVALDVLREHRGTVAIVNHAMAAADLESALRHPWVSVASDGWVLSAAGDGRPHPRSFGTFARVLGHFVREQGLLPLAEAVRRMTGLPASRLGLTDRGVVAVGAVADLVLLDPARIIDRSTFDDPWQLADGVGQVWLAGRPALGEQPESLRGQGIVLNR